MSVILAMEPVIMDSRYLQLISKANWRLALSSSDVETDIVCSWLCQPRPHIIASELHLLILRGRSLESESLSGCGLDLKHSIMSKVALSYCLAVRSVVGSGITNLSPVPLLETISFPSKEEGAPCLSKLSVHVFMLLLGFCD